MSIQCERRDFDGNVAEHIRPFDTLRQGGGEDDMEGCDEGDQEGGDGGQLQDVVDRGEWPVVLGGEEEVDE